MLFAIKNRFVPALVLLGIFVVGGIAAEKALGLGWRMELPPRLFLYLAIGAVALALSDAGLHALLSWTLGDKYRRRYRAMAEYFRPQRTREIIAGGLLAGGEELIFRGILLQWLMSREGMSAGIAVTLTAVIFGLCHALPRRDLLPFTLWAVWEGALLGGFYLWTGSLLACVILHVLHDIAGFSLFAYQRRTGWML